MTFLEVKRLFSKDVLDTRFTKSSWAAQPAPGASATPAQIDPAKPLPVLDGQNGTSRSRSAYYNGRNDIQPSRWVTLEYAVYYIIVGIAVPLMFKSAYDVSLREQSVLANCADTRANGTLASHPSYFKYEHRLSPGWILGRKVDNSDQQYSGFRENIPYMFLLLAIHPILRRTYNYIGSVNSIASSSSHKTSHSALALSADARLKQRVRFDAGFACLYLLALHGTSALKVVAIVYINFSLAKWLPKSYLPLATWLFNVGVLFANEWGRGYPYVELARFLSSRNPASAVPASEQAAQNWGTYLDSYSGLQPRWEILFNITVLRLISFNLDYCWSLDRPGGSAIEVSDLLYYSAHIFIG